jgi:hypothetical protein
MKKSLLLSLFCSCAVLFCKAQTNSFGGGTGTSSNPYILATAANFFELSDSVNAGNIYEGRYFIMTSDVDFNNQNFIPIGTRTDTSLFFKGKVDGQNHSISNFNCVNDTNIRMGLFGSIGTGSEIMNIRMASGTISGWSIVGSIVAFNHGSVVHCSASNQVSVTTSTYYAGGIVGSNSKYGSSVSQCANYATVVALGNNGMTAGGIVGGGGKGSISECYNMGTISGGHHIGGIIGSSDNITTIRNCYNGGTINASVENSGGIMGASSMYTSNDPLNIIENCYNYGAISGPEKSAICGLQFMLNFSNNHYDNATSSSTDSHGTAQSTVVMTGGSFSTTLNGGGTIWAEDANAINSHYPILNWQLANPIGIEEVFTDDFTAWGSNNTINIILDQPMKGFIFIYSIHGGLIAQSEISSTRHSFLIESKGTYLVCIKNQKNTMTRKVTVTQ